MTRRREVWKIGGSILRTRDDYHRCAAQIAGHLKRNPELERLYVVVSAAFGHTDSLVANISGPACHNSFNDVLRGEAPIQKAADLDSAETALRLLQGELDSVHILRSALTSQGVRAKSSTQCDFFPITAGGSYLRSLYLPAESRVRFKLFEQICRNQRLILLSGFGGVNPDNQPVVLGRNASDYVAALLTRLDPQITSATFIKESGAVYVDFETPEQRPLEEIDSRQLWQEQFADLLDRRVLSSITCDFRVCGLDLHGGTWVRVNPAEQEQEVATND